MRDRVYMVLAFLGFVLIVIVIRINYNPGQDQRVYDVGGMYQPDMRKDLVSTQALYQQLIGSRKVQCPVVALSKTKDTVVSLSSIWGSYYDHPYKLSCMFITTKALSGGEVLRPMIDDWRTVLKLSTSSADYSTKKIAQLFDTDIFRSGSYIEIVAPFNFSFDNVNSASSVIDEATGETMQEIVIVNSTGSCRITFGNVANWFCAGEEGTVTVAGTGDNAVKDWEYHSSYHHTVIGNSSSAEVTGGLAGHVIGYASADTTVKIEVFNGKTYLPVSLQEFILPTQ